VEGLTEVGVEYINCGSRLVAVGLRFSASRGVVDSAAKKATLPGEEFRPIKMSVSIMMSNL